MIVTQERSPAQESTSRLLEHWPKEMLPSVPHGKLEAAHRWYGQYSRPHLADQHHAEEQYAASSEISPAALEAVMARYSQKLGALSSEISDFSAELTGLSQAVRQLTNKVSALEETVSDRPIVRLAFLSDLGSAKYRVSRPFPVVLEEYDDESVARWPEVEATGVGASELEAIAMLKHDIVALYEDLRSTRRSELGGAAATALSVLNSVMRRKRG